MDGTLLAALAPVLLLALAFVAYCLLELSRANPRHLPPWAWAVAIVLSVPLGGILFLLLGRDRDRDPA